MTKFLHDPIHDEIEAALRRLNEGVTNADEIETTHIDLKEEPGRRGQTGELLPFSAQNEKAATSLARHSVGMANTIGGGALVGGDDDKTGAIIGTGLDADWLTQRIHSLSQHKLSVLVSEVTLGGHRILVVRSPESATPIEFKGKIYARVGKQTVEISRDTWAAQRAHHRRDDWSVLDSNISVAHARAGAIEAARDFLRESGEAATADLANASDSDLLRRLNVATDKGTLTNAGLILFTERRISALDYIRRSAPGADSRLRINIPGRSVLEELRQVLTAYSTQTDFFHAEGVARGQLRELPERAVREAVVNGIAHRDWNSDNPTVIEHIGARLSVTSPGGFVGGITPDNILTNPSTPRYRALTQVLAKLRVAEHEGIGVDRMTADMLTQGLPRPHYEEIAGPYVRVSLIGGRPDMAWIKFLAAITPDPRLNLDSLLILADLDRRGLADARTIAPVLQRNEPEAAKSLEETAISVLADGSPVLRALTNTPDGSTPAYQLTEKAHDLLRDLRERGHTWTRTTIARDFASHRGRISSAELAELDYQQSTSNMGRTLTALEEDGELSPSRPSRRGPGFHYIWAGS